jgi:hypothetical protein
MNVPDFLDMVKGTMLRGARVTADKEEEIIAALTERSHASRVAREIGDVSFSTVWRVAERAGIELTAGREAKGYKRLAPDLWAKVAETLTANPKATQEQVARELASAAQFGRAARGRHRGAGVGPAG